MSENLMNQDRTWGLSRNVLKIIAMCSIVIGHFILFTWTSLGFHTKWLAYLGISCFIGPPIFMFFIAEGFRFTSSRKKYGSRLLLFAAITQVVFSLSVDNGVWHFDVYRFFLQWNVFFSLFLGFLSLCILESDLKKSLKGILVFITIGLSYLTAAEWGVFGPLMTISYYYLRDRKIVKFLVAFLCCYSVFLFGDCFPGGGFTLYFGNQGLLKQMIFCIIGVTLVCFFYNGKGGKKNAFWKYLFYVAYPLHLLIIDIVRFIAAK